MTKQTNRKQKSVRKPRKAKLTLVVVAVTPAEARGVLRALNAGCPPCRGLRAALPVLQGVLRGYLMARG